jgi:peptidoglycan biosynthesis protein MviN/MurJ (putative lipid II flippase)
LYGVAHYALGDTKTPLRFTIARLALATGLGYIAGGLAAGLGRSRAALGRGGADGIGGCRGVD